MNLIIQKLFNNVTFRGGAVFFVGGIIANIFNYAYRLAMGRMLDPVVFGEVIVILSLILIFATPAFLLENTAAKFVAQLRVRGGTAAVKGFVVRYFFFIVLAVISLGSMALAFSGLIQDFLHLSSTSHIYFLIFVIVFLMLGGANRGILQGLERFGRLSLVISFEGALKFFVAILLVSVGWQVGGALSALVVSAFFVFFLSFYFLRDVYGGERKDHFAFDRAFGNYLLYSFFTFLFLNILLNIDVILVKHYFSNFEAGIFSAVSTIGRTIFIAGMLLNSVLFPVLARRHEKKEGVFAPLALVVVMLFFLTAITSLLFFSFPSFFLQLFFGSAYLEGALYLGYYSIIMGLMALVLIVSSFFMAIARFLFLYVLSAAALLEIVLMGLWHENFNDILRGFLLALLFAVSGLFFLLVKEYKRHYSFSDIPSH